MTDMTIEQKIESTRHLICEIAEVWGVTCMDVGVDVHLPDLLTIQFESLDADPPAPDAGQAGR